jgi:hypothetical protein
MERYNKTIVAMFSGHVHFDSFNLLINKDKIPYGLNLISSAVIFIYYLR